MKAKSTTVLLVLIIALGGFAGPPPATANGPIPFVLRDTTSLPPPAPGMVRLLVSRERMIQDGLKPEYVNVDGKPMGMLPQRSAVTTEVPVGWHRVWLGRGGKAQLWMEFVEDGRYLVRLRETTDGGWRADLVRDARDGYADFATSKGMKLAITTREGFGAMERDLQKHQSTAKQDSLDRESARGRATLPITIADAWYLDLFHETEDFDTHTGPLTLDADSLKYARPGLPTIAIPRGAIYAVRFGGMHYNKQNPWIKIAYRMDGQEGSAAFADVVRGKSTESYNRLFAELEAGLPK